jgi:transposase
VDQLAIDLGSRHSQVCRRRSDGAILEERSIKTRALGQYFTTLGRCRVIVESCAEAFFVADAAIAAGHEVRVVPATLARSLGVGARGVKTDRRDARALSEASCRMDLPSVHIASNESRRLKTLFGMRDGLVAARTQLINTVRGWLRAQAVTLSCGGTKSITRRVRDHAALSGQPLPSYVVRQLDTIDALNAQIADADREIEKIAKADSTCRKMMTVPGIGVGNALLFKAILDDVDRFENAAAVASYLGLTPGERSSSLTVRRTAITKAGSSRMRRYLVQAAWTVRRSKIVTPLVAWCQQIEMRRGKRVAVTALARKLSGILFAIWRDGSSYQPAEAAAPTDSEQQMNRVLSLLGATRG